MQFNSIRSSIDDQDSSARFLVVGCGSIGKRHINNLLTLKAGAIFAHDVQESRRREVESQFCIDTIEHLEDAWAWEPNIALITAPTSMHVPLAVQAANHGCHLFIEKPLSDRYEGVGQLLEAVQEQNLVTLVGCNMRFHPGLKRVRKLIEEDVLGHVVAARVEVGQYLPDWHPWEDYRHSYSARRDMGGGVILDAIHEIDYIRWMLGEIEAVACFSGKTSHLEIEPEDTAAILLHFRRGTIGEVHMDYVQRVYSRTCHIIGDEGTIHWDYTTGEVRWYSAATHEWQVFPQPHDWSSNRMYLAEMQHFLRCVNREEEPTLSVFEGARVLEIALAAKAASKTRQVVELSKQP